MKALDFALRHPITVMVAMAAIALGSIFAILRMRTDVFPDLNMLVIYVAQAYGGMDSAQMEGLISNYYEYAFLYMNGIDHVETKNIQNLALVKLYFHPGTDMAQADHQVAQQQVNRTQDIIAREVAQAYAQLQSATARIKEAEEGIQAALTSATENYEAVGQTKRVGGNIVVLVIRPQEAVAAVQELTLAYANYYGSVADFNRAEFRLYRALGNPAQALAAESCLSPPLPNN